MARSREHRLKVDLSRTDGMGGIRDAGVIFEMMRYDGSRVETFSPNSHLILVADHPHTIARWHSFVWPKVEAV